MAEEVLRAEHLNRSFGSLRAVDDVSFSLHEGEILGLLGPNGAGKTTIIHLLLGLTTADSGRITVFGKDLNKHRKEILSEVNFMSTYASMPNSLKAFECLRVFARLYQVSDYKKRIEEVLSMFEITNIYHKSIRNLSSGQMTRLILAKAFINNPRLLFLDEPTSSLDPDIADKTRRLLKNIKKRRRISILYTSHNMKEMQELSDRLLFLHQGKIIARGSPDELVSRFKQRDLEEAFLHVARSGRP
jgi:ABC-2 type transport system ATP-binding protein